MKSTLAGIIAEALNKCIIEPLCLNLKRSSWKGKSVKTFNIRLSGEVNDVVGQIIYCLPSKRKLSFQWLRSCTEK